MPPASIAASQLFLLKKSKSAAGLQLSHTPLRGGKRPLELVQEKRWGRRAAALVRAADKLLADDSGCSSNGGSQRQAFKLLNNGRASQPGRAPGERKCILGMAGTLGPEASGGGCLAPWGGALDMSGTVDYRLEHEDSRNPRN